MLLDHLQTTAPLPPLVAIAAAVPNIRVSNLVLKTAFYRPGLLTRDLASVDSATGGRLEIGLGAGYVEAEFEVVGYRFRGRRSGSDCCSNTSSRFADASRPPATSRRQ
jgi:alkanesulfonate monooxygenase SsuD/methylene tetrahydromethanopterin reductase-like flavin-dependent oxidoreductase (luciferase family)